MSSSIKLQSSDGEIFEIDIEVAKCSATIKTMLDDCGMGDGDDTVVPLPNVHSTILRKVLEWAEHHKKDPKVAADAEDMGKDKDKERRTDDISEWDTDFLKVADQATLFELMLAANFVDIKGLMDVTCKTVANMMKGKTPAEIRQIFNVKNDFTKAEQEVVVKEEKWCEEK